MDLEERRRRRRELLRELAEARALRERVSPRRTRRERHVLLYRMQTYRI